MARLTSEQLKRKLDYHYRAFDKTNLSPDPVEFPHNFSDSKDIELAAFISSIFAYGSIVQINSTLNKIINIIGIQPYEFVCNYSLSEGLKQFANIRHRFYTQTDIANLFFILKIVCTKYGSLKNLFLLYYFEDEKNIKNSLSNFSKNLKYIAKHENIESKNIRFMFPDPENGSACKRMNLFLRWMVRNDEIDFGLWKEIRKNQLVIPVDTHIARISRELKLTKRKNVSWKMAEEITDNLRKINPIDPVKYDFSLCHIGIRKLNF